MPALGDEFRSAREARGLTLSDVGEKLHIRSVYLNAIESEDWKAIGAPVYVRGFIRTYARFLGLDGEAAIAQYNETVPQERSSAATAVALDDDARTGPSTWAILAIVAALLLVGFVGYEWWTYAQGNAAGTPVAEGSGSPAPLTTITVSTDSPSAAPSSSAPSSPAPSVPPNTVLVPSSVAVGPYAKTSPSGTPTGEPVAGAHELAIRLSERSWLRVVVDGQTVIEGIYPAGTARTFRGNAAEVRAGNGGGVTVSVNGHPPALLGKPGDVVEQRYSL